jgi:hypothetical protein
MHGNIARKGDGWNWWGRVQRVALVLAVLDFPELPQAS